MIPEGAPAVELVDAWRERFARERLDLAAEAAGARVQAERCARLLVERFGAARVYLVGSLARGRGFHRYSDIDLAVSGLPSEHYLTAVDALYRLVGRDIDLIRMEDAADEMSGHVAAEGELLYERTQAPAADS